MLYEEEDIAFNTEGVGSDGSLGQPGDLDRMLAFIESYSNRYIIGPIYLVYGGESVGATV